MANNPYVNKVQKADGTVLMDISDTTAGAGDVRNGEVFYTASGERSVGTMSGGGSLYYGVCDTAAATDAKTVSITGITALSEGLSIRVKFTYAQSASSGVTLNLNSLGAVSVKGVYSSGSIFGWVAGEVVDFVYDGTYWQMVDTGSATTSRYGQTQLMTSYVSSTDSLALTPLAIKNYNNDVVTGKPVYNASSTYAVGDRVMRTDGVYECTTAIPVAEAWDSTHWTKLDPLLDQIEEVKSKTLSLTAAAGSWSSATPPTQTLTATGVTSSNTIIVGLADSATAAQIESAKGGSIRCTAQGTNEITLTCYGTEPEENIPVSVVILG